MERWQSGLLQSSAKRLSLWASLVRIQFSSPEILRKIICLMIQDRLVKVVIEE